MSRKFQVKTVPVSWILHEGRRLDCGPYMSGAIETRILLEKLPFKKNELQSLTRGGISGIINAGRIARIWVDHPDHGYKFLSSADILQFDVNNVSLIAKSVGSQNRNLLIEKNWTLITRSGSIGRMAYAREDMHGLACTEDVLRVIPDESQVHPGYIYAYLSTKFGIPLVTSGTYGSIITHLEPNHIAELPVPRIGDTEEQAHDLIQRAADLRYLAITQINKATKDYFSAAGLEDISAVDWHEKSKKSGFSASLTNANSLRAINFIPLNKELEEYVKTARSWSYISDLTRPGTLRTGPRFKRIDSIPDPEIGVELLGQRECFNLRPDGRWLSKKYLPKDELIFLPEGSTMIAARGGLDDSNSFARCQFIAGKRTQYAYSQDFLRVIPEQDKILPGCLFAFLRSEMAFRMLRGYSIGSIQQEYHPEMVKWMPVPLVDQETANRVNELVVDAYRKYDEAIDCEDQARTLVERAIEEGGR
ncbi:MAG: hypothetical protein PHQ04_00055 [Opitutaceae bacterium]|nr:hypothetical protein [Opitutaceae bacterium]